MSEGEVCLACRKYIGTHDWCCKCFDSVISSGGKTPDHTEAAPPEIQKRMDLIQAREICEQAGFSVVPKEPTVEMISAMMMSQATDGEGTFPLLMDILNYSGENKSRTVLKEAYKAMLEAAREVK